MIRLDKLNTALTVPRAIIMTVTGGFSLAAFLLIVNIIGSVVTENTTGLTPVVSAAAVVGAVTAALFILCGHCVGYIEKDGCRIGLSSYFGSRTSHHEDEFVRLKRFSGVVFVKTKNKKRYLIMLPPAPFWKKHIETLEKLFPFAESDL